METKLLILPSIAKINFLLAIATLDNQQVKWALKELLNCIFGIILVWSLLCSIRVYITLSFLAII